jgi:hypothetical protein
MSNILGACSAPINNPDCPNLLALCAGKWRVSRDPVALPGDSSAYAQVLVGRLGEIYAVGRDRLAVECWDGHVALLVATALGGRLPWQRGQGMFCYLFPTSELEAVAQVIQPRRARHLPQPAPRCPNQEDDV